MSIYDGLVPDFKAKLLLAEADCASQGAVMRPYFGIRLLTDQAKLWRRSRTEAEFEIEHTNLIAQGAPYLAQVLASVGPQPLAKWAINAPPGLSWHEFGEAMDYVWIRQGVACWSIAVDGPKNGYLLMAAAARKQGMRSGMDFGDDDHVQLRQAGSPVKAGMTMPQIDAAMRAKFGGTP